MSNIQCIAMPAMEPQCSSKLYLRCGFFLKKPLHRAFSRTPSTPHTRALPTAPHWVQTRPSCKPCTGVSAARPYLWSGQGDPGKTGAIQQRGKALSAGRRIFGTVLSTAVKHLGSRRSTREVVKLPPVKKTVGSRQISDNT